jgi:hypothetical protein
MDTNKLPPKTRNLIASIRAQLTEKGYPAPEPNVLLDIIVADILAENVTEDIIEFLNANTPEEHPQYQRELF